MRLLTFGHAPIGIGRQLEMDAFPGQEQLALAFGMGWRGRVAGAVTLLIAN